MQIETLDASMNRMLNVHNPKQCFITKNWSCYLSGAKENGVKPTCAGLQIKPCIPRAWGGFEVTRRFQNAVYEIRVENPDHFNKGVRSVTVDGKEVEGDVLLIFDDGKTHRVQVVIDRRD